jgi:hypothetical protein
VTPAAALAMLARQLAAHGEDVTLRRYTGLPANTTAKTDVATRGFVRPVRADQIAGTITHLASNVTVSPSGVGALTALRVGDKVVVAGRETNIEAVEPIRIGSTLVRINLVVMG